MNTGDDEWPPFRVLCVDDNRDVADSTALLLQKVGFQAKACYDGATALELNSTYRPGICFVDLAMPGMKGDELATRLRSSDEWQPILLVALTAMSDEISDQRVFDLCLIKPVDPRQLVEVVDKLFHTAQHLPRPVRSASTSLREGGAGGQTQTGCP